MIWLISITFIFALLDLYFAKLPMLLIIGTGTLIFIITGVFLTWSINTLSLQENYLMKNLKKEFKRDVISEGSSRPMKAWDLARVDLEGARHREEELRPAAGGGPHGAGDGRPAGDRPGPGSRAGRRPRTPWSGASGARGPAPPGGRGRGAPAGAGPGGPGPGTRLRNSRRAWTGSGWTWRTPASRRRRSGGTCRRRARPPWTSWSPNQLLQAQLAEVREDLHRSAGSERALQARNRELELERDESRTPRPRRRPAWPNWTASTTPWKRDTNGS